MGEQPSHGRDETELERVDRNLVELIGELRVALPGVQVLFAFLLVMPFNSGFTEVTGFQKSIYQFTLLATALSAVLLIAPTMIHRLQFRAHNKERILSDSQRLSIAGLSVLAVAMCGSIVLVSDYVFGAGAAVASACGLALAFILSWYTLPALRLRAKRGDRGGG